MAFEVPTTGYVATPRGLVHARWQPVEHYEIAFGQIPQQFKKDPNLFGLLFGRSACFVLIGEVIEGFTYGVTIVNDDGSVNSTITYVSVAGDEASDIVSELISAINMAAIGVQAIASEVVDDKFFIRSTVAGETWNYTAYSYTYARPITVHRLGIISEIAFFEFLLWNIFPNPLTFYPEKWGEIENLQVGGGGKIQITSTDHGLAETLAFWTDATWNVGIPIYIAKTSLNDTPNGEFHYVTEIIDDDNFVVNSTFTDPEDFGVWLYMGDVDQNMGRAQGTQLDLVGNMLGVSRLENELDCNYILALMAKVHCDSSSGTIPDMISALSMLYPNATIKAENLYPAAVRMKVIDDPGKLNTRIKMMRDTQPTGVGLEINTVSSSNPFRMALQGIISTYGDNGSGGTTVTSAAHGLSDGDTVEIYDSTGYDGTYVISAVSTDTFDIAHIFVGTYYDPNDLWIRTARADGLGGFGDSEVPQIYANGGELSSVWVSP